MDSQSRSSESPPRSSSKRPTTFGLLLLPRFSLLSVVSTIDPLRIANRLSGRTLYSWSTYSPDGRPIRASSGLEIGADGNYADARQLDMVAVCGGLDVQDVTGRDALAALRRLASHGAIVGGVCTGTYAVVKAGLMDGYRCTIHWENIPSLLAEFPDVDVTQELFEIDRKRFSCAGGTSGIDMMLSIIARDHGQELARGVTDQIVHHRAREANERQRMDLRVRLGIAHPKLLAVVKRMEETIEQPLSCAELADEAHLSTRQLERLFAKYLGHSPTRHYLAIRLERARDLLQQTSMPILTVAMACGFVSASHFSKSYSEHFGHTPSAERRAGGNRVRTRTRLQDELEGGDA